MKEIFESKTKLREQAVEYRMLGDLLVCAAVHGKELQIARLEHDTFGYDVVLKIDDRIKYVQLKSKKSDGKCPHWDIHRSLINNSDGTVVLVLISYDTEAISLSYRVMDESKRASILAQSPIIDRQDEEKCKIRIGDFGSDGGVRELYSALFATT